MIRIAPIVVLACIAPALAWAQSGVAVATFEADVTPPLGTPLCNGGVEPAQEITDPLTARGLILYPDNAAPIVLCAVDWVGIGNGGHDAWRVALAEAVETPVDRVAVHVLHQHDAPGCDFTAEELATEADLGGKLFDPAFAREAIERVAGAARAARGNRSPVTHVGSGQAKVEKVASNRRMLGPDGRVTAMRWTACRDEELRALPEGTIDPYAKAVSLWNGDAPVVVLTYYATHPQSYYGQGQVSADFVGMARRMRERELPEAVHVHFNGASGNIGAGKYNDGSPENRPVLAERLAAGFRTAWEATEKHPITAADVRWAIEDVRLPLREEVTIEGERERLADTSLDESPRLRAARELAWMTRVDAGHKISLGCLTLGPVKILHMPGELFVEYQLAAQDMAPGAFVCMAAYGDYGPGYIGTCVAYDEGGYETGVYTSRTAPEVEPVLMEGIKRLLAK